MSGPMPEEKVRIPVAQQRWRDLTFIHWDYPPDVVARLLPAGLRVDEHRGRAWVGLTPFLLSNFRVGPLPGLPGLSTFPETNLRTYVRGPDGKDGIFFLSLDVASLPTALAVRTTYRVPYHWAEMSFDRGDVVRYRSRRRTGDARHDICVRPSEGAVDDGDGLVHFLTGRWRAWTRIAGRLASVAVEHEPWPLQPAELVDISESLTTAAGLPAPHGEPLVQFSPGVDVRLGPPRFAPSAAA